MARFLPRLASSPPTHASRARQRPPKDFRQNIFELQPLEVRILMSFVAQMSAPPTGASSTDYAVDLYTTGGVASKWVVNWGDTNTSTYLASSLPNGVFPTPFAPTHQYANSG